MTLRMKGYNIHIGLSNYYLSINHLHISFVMNDQSQKNTLVHTRKTKL